jgi:HSP20 family protein
MNTLTSRNDQPAATSPIQYIAPEVNVYETADGYILEAEMPGVNKSGLEVTIEGTELTILGRRQPEALSADVLYRESRNLDYRRAFELDPAINGDKISAQINQGILTLTLPKAERVKPRKVLIAD